MCSVKKGVLKNFANFTGKHCVGVAFNKVPGLQKSQKLILFIYKQMESIARQRNLDRHATQETGIIQDEDEN